MIQVPPVDFAPIAHQGEALLTTAGARLRAAALVKNDPSVVDHATYYAAVDAAEAAVQADVDAEVAFHNSLAPLWLDLKAARTASTNTTSGEVGDAKAAILSALGPRYIVEQP